jgi:tellurite resistance protein
MAVLDTATSERGTPRQQFRWPRVPPNYLAIAFGVAGLAQAWRAAEAVTGVPPAVPGAIDILAAVLWLVLVGLYLAQGPRVILADLRHPVLSPFTSIAVITGLLLSGALATLAFTAGRVLVIVFLAATVILGGWLTGQWMTGSIDQDSVHPGYFLPTVAGGLVGAYCAARVDLHALAAASFGIGVICWLLLGSTILNRLFTRPAPPAALFPTMAIATAPPAVAGLAWFALDGRTVNVTACVLGGYAILMVLAQLRLIPLYIRLFFPAP